MLDVTESLRPERKALLDGFNEQWVTASRFFSTELLIDFLQIVGERSEEFSTEVDLDVIAGESVGFFGDTANSPYWKVIARAYVERFVHQQQIRRAVGAADLRGDLVACAARDVVAAIAGHLGWLTAPDGTTVAMSLPGAGAWAVERRDDGWISAREPAADATPTFVLDPLRAATILSRGCAANDMASAFTVQRNEELAAQILSSLAPFFGRPPAAPDSLG